MESENNQLNLLRERIVYDENIFSTYEVYEKTLTRLLEDSKFIALSLRYPYQDYSIYELPTKYLNWQLRCSVELYKLIDSQNIKSYSENGLSWTRDSANLSTSLVEEIEPMVGYVGSDVNVL